MSSLLDDFSDMIDEQAEAELLPENVSKRLLVEYQNFLDNPAITYSGVDKNSIKACIQIRKSNIIPWEHVCMTIDVSVLRDISKPKLNNFKVPDFIEEISSIGDKNNSGFGFNEFGRNHLKSIILPSELFAITEDTFAFYRKLESVVIPQDSRLKYIGDRAFSYCECLKELDLSTCSSIETLPDNMFVESSIKKLKINRSVQSLSRKTFQGCRLDSVYLEDTRYSFKEFIEKLENKDFKTFW